MELVNSTERRAVLRITEGFLFMCWHRSPKDEVVYFTKNIGGGGLMCESPLPVRRGTWLDIELYAPMDAEKRILRYMRIRGRVRWTRSISGAFRFKGNNRHEIGIAFEQIDPQDRAGLVQYVKQGLTVGSA